MKKYIFILLLFVCPFSYGQSIQSLNKKSIVLTTGINLKFLEFGNDQGQAVILLHGYTDTGRSFLETASALNTLNPQLKIYALDQRGHGDTSMPNEAGCSTNPETCFAISKLAQDVVAFMDQKKIQKAFIVGHSMGSIVTQELALTNPDRVKGIVLIGSFANGLDNAFIHEYLIKTIEERWKFTLQENPNFKWPQDAYNLKPIDLPIESTNWIKEEWVADPIAKPELLQAIYPETMNISLGTWIGGIQAQASVDNRKRLENLTVPTLILWASQDGAFPLKDQKELLLSLDKAVEKNKISYSYKTYGKKPLPESGMQVDDFGHNLQWAAPKQVAADIHEFITHGKTTLNFTYVDLSKDEKIITVPSASNIITRSK